jgi:uncharacterized membrane-anchored protein YitT (DUF2179 family)
MKFYFVKSIKDFLLIVLAVLFAGLGLKGFLLPNGFLDGGVTGISLLVHRLTMWDLSYLLVVLNLPFIFIGYKQISKIFAVKTFLAIFGLALLLHFIHFPIITTDKLLIAIFGGFFLGGGIGIAMRGGCVLDGTEVLAVYLARKLNLTVGKIIWIVNILIFSCAAILINLEAAMYAILTFLTASKTVDFIIQGIEEYTGITIISEKSEPIRKTLLGKLEKGVTIYKGQKGMNRQEIDIIYTVATRLEVQKLLNEVHKIDANAFIIQQSINDLKGGVIKKRPLH